MSDNLAFYLKYRPQTLSDLIGQESVKKTLLSSFQNNKLSHAYLFVGPRGSGKTSTARILAKMVNCEKPDSAPCNKCPACISITDGSNMDLIEIDAASNRGIDDIRSLRDKIKLSPTGLKKKVYIIDEVHMLTVEAFNALLKTLEEPPKHVLFILATTEAAKIPQTILSRVQRLDFKLATQSEISHVLEKIIKEEKIDIEESALKILVRRAEGSFRDGVKLLDQVSSERNKITTKSLEENLKSTQFDDLLNFIENFAEHDAAKSLLSVIRQLENGIDIKELMLSLMDTLRSLVFIKNGLGEKLVKPQFVEDKYQQLVTLSGDFSLPDLVRVLDILQKAIEKLKFASIPSLPLELAIVEICDKSSEFRVQSSELKEQPEKKTEHQPIKIADLEDRKIIELTDQQSSWSSEALIVPASVDSDSPDILKLKEKWTFVLETIRPFNFSLEALLRSIKVADCTETVVVMEVPYSFHQRILEAPKNRDLLESIFSDILGRIVKVSTILGSRPQRKEDIVNIELAADDEIIRAAAEIFNSDTVN
ncbi:MAG: DNA polymerase III subunit gamma/tau [Candidatus Daviesbacteria bacterium]|nr:DNA polymerase III subunit gamma/tau [Candidatus Daviesbacteria bacterium]